MDGAPDLYWRSLSPPLSLSLVVCSAWLCVARRAVVLVYASLLMLCVR